MKKAAYFATALLFMALTFSSCKTVQDCPAYGQGNEPKTEEIRA